MKFKSPFVPADLFLLLCLWAAFVSAYGGGALGQIIAISTLGIGLMVSLLQRLLNAVRLTNGAGLQAAQRPPSSGAASPNGHADITRNASSEPLFGTLDGRRKDAQENTQGNTSHTL